MPESFIIKECAPFEQFSTVKVSEEFNIHFDIAKIHDETLRYYCQHLIEKAFLITHSQIPEFISHHCLLVSDPMHWLNKFEKLVSVNDDLFHGARNESRLVKLYTSIESKRQEIKAERLNDKNPKTPKKHINAVTEDRYFSFRELKSKVDSLESMAEKIFLITKEKFEYNRTNIDFVNTTLPLFPSECDKLIDEIQTLDKIQNEIRSTENAKKSTAGLFPKIKTNLNVNQLVDVFYQLQREITIEGKPAIEAETSELAQYICNSFIDRDGNLLSSHTVKTILMPTKPEKRPKGPKRLDITGMI